MRDESEVPDAPRAKLKPANENPWYVLMTLYGDDENANRRVWNAWASQVLTQQDLQDLGKNSLDNGTQFALWEDLKDEVKAKFEYEFDKRNGPNCVIPKLPNPQHPVRLGMTCVSEVLDLDGFVFPRGVYLSNVTFLEEVYFCHAVFLKDVSFRRVRFADQVFFAGARFMANFDLSGNCKGDITFNSSVFHRPAAFRDSDFHEGVRFELVDFLEEAHFADAKFRKGTSFARGRFRGRVRFWDVDFGEPEMGVDLGPVFRDCQFEEPADFRSARFHDAFPELSGAVLHAQTRFSGRANSWPKETSQNPELARDSCSTIRHALSKQGLPEDEHFFFRKEMHFAGKIGSIWQRLPYLLFGLFSDYGHSILRPTLWLLGLWAFGFAVYWGYLAGCCVPAPLEAVERPMGTAMGLSFSNLFPLFGFGRTFLGDVLNVLPPVLKLLSGFQTVASLPLLFFLGLGLRQRFRLR